MDQPRPCHGATGRLLDDALLGDLRATTAALDARASNQALAGHPLGLEQHVHLAHGDDVATLTETSTQFRVRRDHVSDS